ncbi:MAG: hypothetical protein HRF40_04130 [Nitrososphaera sp.]
MQLSYIVVHWRRQQVFPSDDHLASSFGIVVPENRDSADVTREEAG